MDKGKPIIIGDVTPVEHELFEKEVPDEVKERIPRLASMVRIASRYTGKPPVEIVEMIAQEPDEFRRIVREAVHKEEETRRLAALARRAYEIKEGLSLKLREGLPVFPLPYGTNSLRPIEQYNPENWEGDGDTLESSLKKMLKEI